MLYDVLFLVFTLYRHRNRIPFDAITIPIVELLIDNANAQMGSVEHVHIFCNIHKVLLPPSIIFPCRKPHQTFSEFIQLTHELDIAAVAME